MLSEISQTDNNIGVSRGHYAKWNKPDRDKYSMFPLKCGVC